MQKPLDWKLVSRIAFHGIVRSVFCKSAFRVPAM